MARTPEQVRKSLSASAAEADPTADLAKGPIYDLMLRPVAPEIAALEERQDSVRTLASLQLDKVTTEAEINAIGTAFGLPNVSGKPASCRQTFFTSSRPTSDIVIERGTLVGTTDSSRIFVVTERVVMLASAADAYYNAARRRYEITAKIESTSIGSDSNLPAFRIKRLFTTVTGLDRNGTENREAATGGTDRQSFSNYLRRIRLKFLGVNPETGAGIASQAFEYAPESISDVMMVYPKDRKVFRRDTGRPAIDLYVIGSLTESTSQRYVAIGGETSIALSSAPVLSIGSVQIDSAATTAYTLLSDPNPALTGSSRASDVLILTTPLTAGQVIDITYTYDALVSGMQANVFDANGRQFGTDILVRRPEEVPVSVQVDVTVLPSFDVSRATDAVNTIVFEYIETNVFIGVLLPETLQQRILDGVAGVSSVKIQRFTATNSGALPVEAINLQKNQIPTVDQTNLLIATHQ